MLPKLLQPRHDLLQLWDIDDLPILILSVITSKILKIHLNRSLLNKFEIYDKITKFQPQNVLLFLPNFTNFTKMYRQQQKILLKFSPLKNYP